jgi:hyperosmotically inducible protein
MKRQLLAGFVAVGLALAPAAWAADKPAEKSTASKTTEKVKENVSDAAITAKIKTEFAKDKQVSALTINVDTDNKGVVTLKGSAKTNEEKAKAESIAKSVSGVTSVKNEIQVTSAMKK